VSRLSRDALDAIAERAADAFKVRFDGRHWAAARVNLAARFDVDDSGAVVNAERTVNAYLASHPSYAKKAEAPAPTPTPTEAPKPRNVREAVVAALTEGSKGT
jgi:hypothetical protein